MRQSRLFCTRWNGLDKASGVMEASDDKEYSGSLILAVAEQRGVYQKQYEKELEKDGGCRVELPDYPERAVLECLVNALIHRDYSDMGSEVHIDIYDDRLEIYSPGRDAGRVCGAGAGYRQRSFQAPQSRHSGHLQPHELHGAPRQRIQEDQAGLCPFRSVSQKQKRLNFILRQAPFLLLYTT